MRVLHWCMLGVTILLLVCEVTISQLCKSLIILVDGFHTIFIMMRMALTPPQTSSLIKPPLSSLDSPASPPHASSSSAGLFVNLPAESSIKPTLCTQTTSDGSTLPDQASTPQPQISPPVQDCGLSYPSCRVQTVGAFISALLLASLCLSYIMEIISFSLEPQPVQHPLLLVVVSIVSLIHKMLVLWMNWDQQQALQIESHLEVNHKGTVQINKQENNLWYHFLIHILIKLVNKSLYIKKNIWVARLWLVFILLQQDTAVQFIIETQKDYSRTN